MSPRPGASVAKIGIEALHDLVLAADHQAVAALEAPDAAARAHVDVVEALRREALGARDVVLVVRVAAVDDGVARREQRLELVDGSSRRRRRAPSGRGAAASSSFLTNSASDERPGRALLDQRRRRPRPSGRRPRRCGRLASAGAPCWRPSVRARSSRTAVVVARHQSRPPCPSRSAILVSARRRSREPVAQPALLRWRRRARKPAATSGPRCTRSARRLALGQHLEVAAGLRRLDDAERVLLSRAPGGPSRRRR